MGSLYAENIIPAVGQFQWRLSKLEIIRMYHVIRYNYISAGRYTPESGRMAKKGQTEYDRMKVEWISIVHLHNQYGDGVRAVFGQTHICVLRNPPHPSRLRQIKLFIVRTSLFHVDIEHVYYFITNIQQNCSCKRNSCGKIRLFFF